MKSKYVLMVLTGLLLCSSCTRTEKSYYPNGHIQSSIQYRFGKEHGMSIYYFDVPNTVEIEVEMKRGKRNGSMRRYFENGMLDTHCEYVNDLIEGVEVNFTANGEKAQEFTYVHGVKNGPHRAYFVTGEIKVEGNFKDDMFDGEWKYYDERGVMVGEGSFNEGEGSVVFYDVRGLPLRKTHYKHNKKDGEEVYYTQSGEIYRTIVFKQDRIISEQVDSTLIQ